MTDNHLTETRESLIAEIERRVEEKILERTNANLLIKLIRNADSLTEAISIAQLGTTYKKTGFHYDKRLEPSHGNTIKYFKKNEELSFSDGKGGIPHKLIIGDNFDALQNLLIQYRGKVDVIYIDPPYGKDSMGEFAKTNYDNALTRDNLLSMLYPRLYLAKQLLSDDGVIFCSMDDRNQAYVKCLFDEVFGENNFITSFVWEKTQHFGRQKLNYYSNVDYVVCYARKKIEVDGKIKTLLVERIKTELEDAPLFNASNPSKTLLFPAGKVKLNIPDGTYSVTTDDKYILHSKVVVKDHYNQNDFELEFRSRWARQTVLDEIKIGTTFIVKSTKFAIRAIYSDGRESQDSPKQIIFTNSNNEFVTTSKYGMKVGTSEDGTGLLDSIVGPDKFDYPKPASLIAYLVSLFGKKDALVLDFFAGSGTTAQGIAELNKQGEYHTCILCTLNEITDKTPHGVAFDVTAPRLKRIMTGSCYPKSSAYPFYTGTSDFDWIKNNAPYGGSLDVYEIASVSNAEHVAGKTPFDVIDETLYGKERFSNLEDKIQWVCENFDNTQNMLKEKREEE